MKKELIISIALHIIVVMILVFGRLPSRSFKDEEQIIPVDIVSIDDVTQSNKPSQAGPKVDEPKPQPKAEEPPKPVPESAPEKPQPPKSEGIVEKPENEKQEETREEEPEESEEPEEEEPEPEHNEAKVEEDILEPEPEKEEKPKEPEKPKEVTPPSLPKLKPKPPVKKDKKQAKKEKFQNLLKNLVDSGKASSQEDESKEDEATSSADESDDLPKGDKMSATELALVKRQISRCWKVDVGAKNIKNLKVPLRIKFNPDTSVKSVEVLDQDRYNSDPFYQAAARRAISALKAPDCTPLKLPLKKYDQWKDIKMTFDPEAMAGEK
ncbi:MAG: hypothetical protein J0G29_04350 [Alphaproteobacteria bacterium]|nr:hypothetical protein [Alphaproteobacteria bacterium]OJV47555.1 MAG: hypothetical protein BGO28_06890 [Alphaproteobacteria bacterium 43-37]